MKFTIIAIILISLGIVYGSNNSNTGITKDINTLWHKIVGYESEFINNKNVEKHLRSFQDSYVYN